VTFGSERRFNGGFNACHGGGFGTNIKLYSPGTYTFTGDIEMERGPTTTRQPTIHSRP
jgi:hypothetical protein